MPWRRTASERPGCGRRGSAATGPFDDQADGIAIDTQRAPGAGRFLRTERVVDPEDFERESETVGIDRFEPVDPVDLTTHRGGQRLGVVPRVASDPHRHAVRPGRYEPKSRCGDDPQRPFAAAQQTGEVISGVVLQQSPEPADDRAVAEHGLDADHVGPHRAISQHADAACVRRHHAADRRRVASTQVDAELPTGRPERGSENSERDAGFDRRLTGVDVDGADGAETLRAEHDLTRGGNRAADQSGVAALRDDGDTALAAAAHDARHVRRRAGPHDYGRLTSVATGPIAPVRGGDVRIDDHVVVTDDGAQVVEGGRADHAPAPNAVRPTHNAVRPDAVRPEAVRPDAVRHADDAAATSSTTAPTIVTSVPANARPGAARITSANTSA